MNRRQFLKLIGVSTSTAALSVFGTWRLSKAPRARTLQTHVAGAPYHIGHWTEPGEVFVDGKSLRPVREPANPHDANAIALYSRDKKVGFVPRASNRRDREGHGCRHAGQGAGAIRGRGRCLAGYRPGY